MHPRGVRERDLDVQAVARPRSRVLGRARHHQRRRVGREARGVRVGRGHAARRRRGRPRPARRDLIGLGPFLLADPSRWDRQRERLVRSIETAVAVGARVHRLHDRPVRAARRGRRRPTRSSRRSRRCSHEARARGIDFAIEHTNSAAGRRGVRAHAARRDRPRRAGSTPVCAWSSTRAGPNARSRRRSATGIDRIRLVQVSDFKVGTVASSQRLVPGDGDIPIRRILGELRRRRLRRTCSSSSSSATRSSPRATTLAVPRARRARSTRCCAHVEV